MNCPCIQRNSIALVFIVAADPGACLVKSLGRAVEPGVHTPEGVHSARIGGIGAVDAAVIERERAHALPLARIPAHVGPGHGRELSRPRGRRSGPPAVRHRVVPAEVVVGPITKLLTGDGPSVACMPASVASGARETAQSITSWLASLDGDAIEAVRDSLLADASDLSVQAS